MAASDFRKKALVFVAFAGTAILILLLLPLAEGEVYRYVQSNYGYTVNPSGIPEAAAGSQPGMMVETSVSLLVHLFRVVKILLWMALIIAVVRFGAQVVVSTFRAHSEASSLVKTVVSIIVYIVAFFIIFQTQYPDVPLAPLFTGSTILGIVVGLALQDTLGNLFAGIALQADQPFQIGDVITFTNREGGVIESATWRGIKIRTFQNKVLIISNAVLGKEIFEVAPKANLNARVVFFNTVYTQSPAKTMQALRDAIRQIENVSQKIRPVIRIRNLGDFGIDWEVKYWLNDYTQFNDTDALVRQRVWYVFQREGIEFAYPTHTVHIAEKQIKQPFIEYVNTVSEYLQGVPLFAPLSEEEVEKLAQASNTRVYAPGEPIVRRGLEGNSMFVITRGSVKVQIPEHDYQKTINKLKANDFFGEMSLLTGQPRAATVIAEEETEVIQIKKSGIKPLFEANPDLMTSICEIVEERRLLLVQKDEEAEALGEADGRGVLSSIRRFFGIR